MWLSNICRGLNIFVITACSIVDWAGRSIGVHSVAFQAGTGQAKCWRAGLDEVLERQAGRSVWQAWPGRTLAVRAGQSICMCSVEWQTGRTRHCSSAIVSTWPAHPLQRVLRSYRPSVLCVWEVGEEQTGKLQTSFHMIYAACDYSYGVWGVLSGMDVEFKFFA